MSYSIIKKIAGTSVFLASTFSSLCVLTLTSKSLDKSQMEDLTEEETEKDEI